VSVVQRIHHGMEVEAGDPVLGAGEDLMEEVVGAVMVFCLLVVVVEHHVSMVD